MYDTNLPVSTATASKQSEKFSLKAVIVCNNYADFLSHALLQNKPMFDEIVVVTAPEDKQTQRVCEYMHVKCVQTDVLRSRWKEFCKGAGINAGLAELLKTETDLVVHMDADIVLPPLTRKLIEGANLDRSMIYGCDRVMCKNFNDWMKFVTMPRLQHENEVWMHMDQFPFGHRVAIHGYGGYIPIGFFQMWSPTVSGIDKYPEGHKTAAREDTDFALLWPRAKRALLPEVIAYHLESEVAPMAANWGGRKTKIFGPEE